jgi:hypothetical protein
VQLAGHLARQRRGIVRRALLQLLPDVRQRRRPRPPPTKASSAGSSSSSRSSLRQQQPPIISQRSDISCATATLPAAPDR